VKDLTRRALLRTLAAAPAAMTSEPPHAGGADCVFCKIIRGEAEATVVYRDARFIAFADLYPLQAGHLLLVPLAHVESIYALSDDLAAQLFPVAARLARVLKKALSADGMTLIQNNDKAGDQAVFHFHLHLVPRTVGRVVLLRVVPREKADRGELEKVFAPVRAALG